MTLGTLVERVTATILVVCAVTVTSLLVRRELFGPTNTAATTRHIKDWRTYAVGPEMVGPADATTTLVVFSDFQCPFCARLATALQKAADSVGLRFKVVHRNLPITQIHPYARPAAIAALCAAMQGRFKEYSKVLYEKHDSLATVSWTDIAQQVGVRDTIGFSGCLVDGRAIPYLRADSIAGAKLGVTGTPTLLINDRLISGAPADDSLFVLLRTR